LAKRKESGFQGRKQKRAIERILSLLPEHAAAGLREQMRRERASHKGKTQLVTLREEALTRYLAWIGEPDRPIAEIIGDLNRPHIYSLRDDPVGHELREKLKLALDLRWLAAFQRGPWASRALALLAQGWTLDELERKLGPIKGSLRAKLELAAAVQSAKPRPGARALRRYFEDGQRGVWKRR
jgi:hypothetical protein